MLTVESLCVYSLQWCLSSLSGSNVLSLEGTGKQYFTTTGPWSQPLWPSLGSPWQPFGTPGTRLAAQASSHRLRKQPRGPQTLILELSPACRACFHFSSWPVFLPFWIIFGTLKSIFWDPGALPLDPFGIWRVLPWHPWPPSGPYSVFLGSL